MLGKAIFARRASQPATAPSSQLQVDSLVSTPSRFTRKLRKIKQVFKRSSSLDKDASPSIVHPRQDLPVAAHPRQVLQTASHSSQGPNSVTQRGVESFNQRPRPPYPGLPPVLNASPRFQPREETFATSPLPTPARSTSSGNSPLLHAPLRTVNTTPANAFSPRSTRSSPRFRPQEDISATSTLSTASRPTFSLNPSITLTPPQSFNGTPSVHRSPHTSPLLRASKEIPTASTPSTTPYPTSSPNSSLLAPPQSVDTTPTMISSQSSQPAADDSAAARKIADLRATIAALQLKRDDYLHNVQHELRNRICPRVRAYQKQRDDQVAALERAKAELAHKIEVRDKVDAMWREQREARWEFDGVASEVKTEWLEKLKRCRELEIESVRLLFQQEQWVRRGWRRREWGGDDSEYIFEASTDQYSSVQQSSYTGGSSEYSQSRYARSAGSVSTDWAPRRGLYIGNESYRVRRPSTQGSSSIEFEMVGETVRSHPPVRTSQPSRGTLDEFGSAGTHGSSSRYASGDYSDDYA